MDFSNRTIKRLGWYSDFLVLDIRFTCHPTSFITSAALS